MTRTVVDLPEFWESIATRLGDIEREIHERFIGTATDAEYRTVEDAAMAGAVRAKQLRDGAIIKQWERRPMPVVKGND